MVRRSEVVSLRTLIRIVREPTVTDVDGVRIDGYCVGSTHDLSQPARRNSPGRRLGGARAPAGSSGAAIGSHVGYLKT